MHARPNNIINRAGKYSAIDHLFQTFWHFAEADSSLKG